MRWRRNGSDRRAVGSARPIASGPGGGMKVANPAGGAVTFKARAEETAGSLSAFETVVAPGEGPPLHVHADEDEFVYLLEGLLLFRLEDTVQELTAGSFVFIPRGCLHTWQNAGAVPARFLFGFTPAAPGMEQFFERAAELPDAVRGAEAFPRFASDAGMEVAGPPLSS